MSIERHLDEGWVAAAPAKPKPEPPTFRAVSPTSSYYAHHAEAMNHGGTYMTVSAHKRPNEVTVSIMPAGVSLSFDLTLDAGLALADEIRKAVDAARPVAAPG